jgi:periplasmic protein TonB
MPNYRAKPSRPDRAKAIAGVIAVYAVMIGAMLLVRTDTSPRTVENTPPVLIEIEEPPPPPPPEPGKAREEEGAAGKKDEPTPIVVPQPKIVVPAKPPVPAAPVAGTGSSPNAGAAAAGTGPGAGGSGTGRGGGGADGGGSPAQWLSGGLKDSDYPRAALRSRLQGQVSIRFTVLTNGRIANCRVVRSSGSGLLDATTCQLLTKRLHFRPATNGTGRPIQTELGSDYTWGINLRR